MKPAISQVCTLGATWARDVDDYAAAACDTLELWLGKLESYLADHSIDDARRLLDDHGVAAPVASFQGGLLTSQGDARRAHWDHFARRLAICRALGANILVIAGDVGGPLSPELLTHLQRSLADAAQLAGEHGLRLALEFQAGAAFPNNLQSAAALVAEVGSPNLGICLDAFHFCNGPSKEEDLGYLSNENLFHVQLSDAAGIPRELTADADRVLPGDGDWNLQPIVDRLRAIGYSGCVSIELMNPQIWQIPPRQVAEVGMTALRKLLGQASMA